MFKKWREIYAKELTKRFLLDVTPDEHTLLAMKLNVSINTNLDGPQLMGKTAKAEVMKGIYMRSLRRQATHRARRTSGERAPARDGDGGDEFIRTRS